MGATRSTNLKTVLGRSIFAADGASWRAARDMMRPLAALLLSLTLDSATELFLGQSTSTLQASLDGDDSHLGMEFHHAFERMVAVLETRVRLRSFYWLYGTRELRLCVETLHGFVDIAITASDMAKKEGSSQALYDFLNVLRERCSGGDEEVREQILGLLAAGRDTTASLMSWTWYCLLHNPRVFVKLRSEILSTFGCSPDGPSVTMTFASLKECTYLQHVLSETLRLPLYPSTPAARSATRPSQWAAGRTERAPSLTLKEQRSTSARTCSTGGKDLWGEEDADDFVPERWEKQRGAASAAWHFVPFNGGPRICIGQKLALTEAGYVLVRMLQRYDAVKRLDVDLTRDWHNFTVVCSPGSPVNRNQAVLCQLKLA
ncbi:cytochrome P450 [Fusarium oxysporum Fo47]|nr:cytochrome P450 [Fusarium oxysporum Fo47]QKD55266.2 cytochrome P450 [Fusarium oxysporum Fo47]